MANSLIILRTTMMLHACRCRGVHNNNNNLPFLTTSNGHVILLLLHCCESTPHCDRRRSLTGRSWFRPRCISLPGDGEERQCREKTARGVSQEERKGYKTTTAQRDWGQP